MKRPPVLGSQDNSRDGSLDIETQGLSKSFGSVTHLRPLDLKISRNSIFGFLDPKGRRDILNIMEGLPPV